jgi:hypothetical protein
MLLNIAHYRFGHVPWSHPLSLGCHTFAIVCDKYDLVHLTRPFLKRWPAGLQHEKRVHIAWVFECHHIFTPLIVPGVRHQVFDDTDDKKSNDDKRSARVSSIATGQKR